MSLLKSASTVSAFTLASRITGLVREALMASAFGVSAMTDAFNVAFRIPNMFRRLFAEGAFAQAFVPILSATRASQGEQATQQLIDRVASVLLYVLLLTCILGIVGAPLLVWSMASGLLQNPRGFESAVLMTRFMFPYIALMSLVALASGILNTYRNFAIPAATPVLLNLALICAAWFGAPWFKAMGFEPIYAMAVGVMVGGVLQLAVQWPALKSIGRLPAIDLKWAHFRSAWRHESTQNVANKMLPALLGVSVAQLSLLINTQIASHQAPGSVSWLNYSDRLMEFPVAMLGVALGVVLVPQLASARAGGDAEKYASMLDWGLRLAVLLSVPAAVALLVFTQPLVAMLFHFGAFSDVDVQKTSLALMGWGVGLLGLVAIKVLAPGYFASGDVKTPALIAVAVLLLTQMFNWFLVPHLAHAALSLSIGLGALVNALWLLVGLLKRGSYRPEPGWLPFALQVIAASALLAVFLMWSGGQVQWLSLKAQPFQRTGLVLAMVAAGACVYFAALSLAGLKLRQFLRH